MHNVQIYDNYNIKDEICLTSIIFNSYINHGRKPTILTMKLYEKLQQYSITSRDSMAADNSVHISNKVDVSQYLAFCHVSPKLCYAGKKHVSQVKSNVCLTFLICAALLVKTSWEITTDMDDIEEMAKFKDIPDTFVGIQPEKYPLIITFHKNFLLRFEGLLIYNSTDFNKEGRRSVALQTFIRKNEVTYDRFRSLYWPHFNAKLTKNLDPSRVFTEILSNIKGGLQEGACNNKRSRQDYISLSDRRLSTFSAEKRVVLYDIFEDYEKMKLELGEFDLADFVIDIHLHLNNENLLGDKMDFAYIDEVQDLAMRQISLFRYICKNVDEGFVFSGDTTQTVARGIDFLFEDIRCLFYNEEKGLISDIFSLSQNLRTHTRVLRLAQSVINLICHFPPKSSGKWVGFGADQEVSNYIGHQALILTIVECNGLEFQIFLMPILHSLFRVLASLDPTYYALNRNNYVWRLLELWFCENNEEVSKPMLDYWRRLCLVQMRKLDDSLAEAMQRASSPKELKSQGIKMATMCFEKTGKETWEKRAMDSGLGAAAVCMVQVPKRPASIMLTEAAEIFDSIDRDEFAAECFEYFLEKCSLECYWTKDNASLMKFVRAFHMMDSKRNFLKSLDCLEESFPQKEELLTIAMSVAQKVSGNFHALICAEAKILFHEPRNLSELMQCYDSIKCEGAVRFYFNYFGVRLPHNLSVPYLLLKPIAAWVRNVDERFMVRNIKVGTLDTRHFMSAAQNYWCQELISAGLKRETELSKNLLEEIISMNISTRNELTYGQIGRAVMIMLGSGKQKHDLYEKIAERFCELILEMAKDCISPNCSFILVLFRYKIFFCRILICLQTDANPSAVLSQTRNPILEASLNFLSECSSNAFITLKKQQDGLQIFILIASTIFQCLSFNILFKMLGVPQIRSQLLREFCEAIRYKKNDNSYAAVIVGAFKIIEDALMIVASSKRN
ncbi:hypothetical protein Pfo_003658 [Paulownia fortunei]|nr:hypothetical protein Pfo_003658 [Paulownia fortunei]